MYTPKNLTKVRVWDLPTRIFHWLLVAGIIGLGISGTLGGNVMVWHFRIAYAVLALLLFRIIWGVVGGRWSRFGAFIYSPQSVINYLKGKGKPEHSVGHSPVGAGSVIAMLGILLLQVVCGLVSDDEIAFAGPLTRFVSNAVVGQATGYHKEIGQYLVMGLVALHLLAVLFYVLVRRERLVRPMVHGDKTLPAPATPSRDDAASRALALVVLAASGALAWWVSTLAGAAAF